MRTRIKICGVKTIESAYHAADAGADAFGLVFHEPSIRHLSLEQAAEIARQKPAFINSVAVMVNPEKDFVRSVLDQVRPDYLQFHGEESAAYCRSFGARYIRSIRVKEQIDLSAIQKRYPDASALLVDAYRGDDYGGTGDAFNWEWVNFDCDMPVFLAGGLDHQNVSDAICKIGPYGVDVSTGVETQGNKDVHKIKQFCKAVWSSSSKKLQTGELQ